MRVKWEDREGQAEGKIIETFDSIVCKMFGRQTMIRQGSKENLALLIEKEDGTKLLKVETEVSPKF